MSSVKQISKGFEYFLKGINHFFKNPRLWLYALIPTILDFLFLGLLFYILFHYFPRLTEFIFGSETTDAGLPAGFFENIWQWTLGALIWLLKAFIFLVFVIFICIAGLIFSLVIVSPFNDLLSEKVETGIGSFKEEKFTFKRFAANTIRSVKVALQNLLFFLTVPIVLLFLHLIPAAGSVLYFLVANAFSAFDMGFAFMDYPMERRMFNFKKRLKIAYKHKNYLLGFGLPLLVPGLALILNSPVVIGATLMYVEVIHEKEDYSSS